MMSRTARPEEVEYFVGRLLTLCRYPCPTPPTVDKQSECSLIKLDRIHPGQACNRRSCNITCRRLPAEYLSACGAVSPEEFTILGAQMSERRIEYRSVKVVISVPNCSLSGLSE